MKEIRSIKEKRTVKKMIILLFWILLWQLLAVLIGNSILLVGPLAVIKELIRNMQSFDFYRTIGMSFIRIAGGFIIGFLTGLILGIAAFFYSTVREVLAPVIALLKSIPIASFVVLLLIWMGSKNLAVYISILVVLPNAYLHTLMGLSNTDEKLLEMAEVFQVSFWHKFRYLYKPAMIPFLISCMEVAVGMSFKSGVAAEVIGTPKYSFGEKLYMSKIHLNTSGIFAWTIVIILVSYSMEKGVLYLLRRYKNNNFSSQNSRKYCIKNNEYKEKALKRSKHISERIDESAKEKIETRPDDKYIRIKNLSKEFEEKEVISKLNLELEKGKSYCLMGPSGCGKTTFFNILLGLIKPDTGEILGVEKHKVSAAFQEPRLLEEYSAFDNAFLFGTLLKESNLALQEFQKLLPLDAKNQPAKDLSGGMQQRVAIIRAMAAKASLIILDEPFTGLDEETKKKTAEYILERKCSRTLIISTHNKEDVLLLKGEIIDGNKSSFNWNHGGEE